MSDREGTREQPSIEDPARLSIEHLCLAVALVALVIAVGGLFVQAATHHDMLRGGYSVLAALVVCGVAGFLTKLVLLRVAVLLEVLLEVRQMLRQLQGHDTPVAPEAEAALRRIGIKLLQGGREIG